MAKANVKHTLIDKYHTMGSDKFYSFLLYYSLDKLSKLGSKEYDGPSPEIELLDYYEQVMSLYRKGASKDHLELAKLFRRAAHKVYRDGLKKNLINRNNKFLNVVS